jgi:hypothetical protein
MEKYFASDDRPLEMCLADVAQCDLYIGIFAWRYGTVPADGNPEHRSITECEFREAVRLRIPCLIFLSKDQPENWPHDGADDREGIERLRGELERGWSLGYFDTPDSLGLEVSVAVSGWRNKPDLAQYLASLVSECAELPELPDRTKNLSLNDIISIKVNLPPKTLVPGDTNKPAPRIVDLAQGVAEERAWFLVGDGGEGKSTALRFLAHHYASLWLDAWKLWRDGGAALKPVLIPILIELRAGRPSLRETIWAALQRSGFQCNVELVDTWILRQPILFLVDRLEVTETRWMLEDLEDLMRLAPHARLVIASRPLNLPVRCTWPQAHLQPAGDSALRSFLRTLLGPARGADVFDVLAQNGLLDPFRRPLFARLLALSSPELIDQQRFTPGEMFRDVLEGRFLRQWEDTSDSQVVADLMRDILALAAHAMVGSGTYVIERDVALRLGMQAAKQRNITVDTRTVELALARTVTHGLMSAADAGLQFWHSSFRDYFAAVWLADHATAAVIYARSWDRRWHECLVFYFGFLRGRLLDKRLRQLLVGVRLTVLRLRIQPSSAMSDRLIFILRCLVQAREARSLWAQRFIRQLPVSLRYLFLSGSSAPAAYAASRDMMDRYRYFCDLIGQLRVPEAFDYLGAQEWLAVVAPGVIHDPDVRGIERLAQSISASKFDNGLSSMERAIIGRLLLTSRDARCFQTLTRVILDSDNRERACVLHELSHGLQMFQSEYDSSVRAELASQWAPVLIDLALHDEDETVRGEAVRLLTSIGVFVADRGSLPDVAHEALLGALSDPRPHIRARALAGLRYPALKQHMDIAWRLLDEPSITMVFATLDHFFYSGSRQRFCHALLKVLRRHAFPGSDLKAGAEQVHQLLGFEEPSGTRIRRRSLALLISAVLCGEYLGFRSYAVRALDTLRLEGLAPFLRWLLRSDAWEDTRCAAFDALLNLDKVDAGELIIETLRDQDADVRGRAAVECFRDKIGADFHPIAGPILFGLLGDDSEFVRRYATITLQRYGYLAKDWYAHMGSPVYLGPDVPSAHPGLTA